MLGGWRALGADGVNPPSVVPLNDLRPHDADSSLCWCRPRMRDGVLVHNSADRREEWENGRPLS